ncbi:Family S9 non peptidase ue S09 family [Fasciola gigantica]|uniref:Family S9 non peptidase ue S09 family n=1 Tax=Fasciola gigantica TaxID=46835 RepID=A0A504YN85_FASGI|nr:Family S9 non peptidase ue S09 family [Fasciola gigantica]
MDIPKWKLDIVNQLLLRDQQQAHAFEDLIHHYGSLRSGISHLDQEKNRCEQELKACRQEVSTLTSKLEMSCAMKSYDYEQKVFRLQEEVTDLHRQKGALAADVIELSKAVQERDRALASSNSKLTELESNLKTSHRTINNLTDKVHDLDRINKLIMDEKFAMDMTLKSLEEKNREIEEDKQKLLTRVAELQETIQELRNIEHDIKYRKNQETIRKNLAEAASVVVDINEPDYLEASPCIRSVIPQKALMKIDANDGEVNSVRFTPSGNMFGSAGFDRKLRLWAITDNKCELRSTLVGCNAAVTAIDFDPHETVVLGASSDFSCRVWTLNDSRLRVNLTGHSERVVSAKFMSSSNRIVTISSDRTIKLWDVERCMCKRTIMATSSLQDVLACGPLCAVITGHFDHKVRVWDERTGAVSTEVAVCGRVTGLDISSDMRQVLACTRNNTLEVVSLRTNKVCDYLTAEGFRVGLDIVRPCFSADALYAVAGGQDGCVYIWNRQTRQLEACLQGHSNTVVCCHWSPAGHMLISCERTNKAILWGDN